MSEAVVVAAHEGAPTFEEYVAARAGGLWRTAWLLTGDAQLAEDLVQTVLVRCWRTWERIARDGAVDGYVRRALVTSYVDSRRRRWRGEVPSAELPEVVVDDGSAVERRDMLRALAGLPRGQRAVVVLRFYDDLTEVQTAEVLGISVGTVKSQTARALKALRESGMLEERA